ncbi:polyprenyl synthetase family protein [Kitasatospora phosalacinea]|uniref:Polyprenyl synthetase family protein n=1 Tax=Kitasatospora phosalacinea TaxID=2065 RepID=A0ABW6GVY1_9ACTN
MRRGAVGAAQPCGRTNGSKVRTSIGLSPTVKEFAVGRCAEVSVSARRPVITPSSAPRLARFLPNHSVLRIQDLRTGKHWRYLIHTTSDLDAPHNDCGVEWWYLNFHLEDIEGPRFSGFAAFFRFAVLDADGSPGHWHAVNWALLDVRGSRYRAASEVDPRAVSVMAGKLRVDRSLDPSVRRAALAHLERTGLPVRPDVLTDGRVEVHGGPLSLAYGSRATLTADESGRYRLQLRHAEEELALDLEFSPRKASIGYGADGRVRGREHDRSDEMRYDTITRLDAAGTVRDGEGTYRLRGSGWYDHEFGGQARREPLAFPTTDRGWDWAGLQLDDGWDVSCYDLYEEADGERRVHDHTGMAVSPEGVSTPLSRHRFTPEPGDAWTSLVTFHSYPQQWRITDPDAGLDLHLRATTADQELRTMTTGLVRGYWEGRVEVTGTHRGHPVTGRGFVEILRPPLVRRFESLLARVGAEVRRETESLYPKEPTPQWVRHSGLVPAGAVVAARVNSDAVHACLVPPVRHLVDQGGKSWRAMLLLAAVECCGTSAEPYRPLAAASELLHAGSLIIDDIEDRSARRRGAPASHLVFGTSVAINAATAAYFAFDTALQRVLRDRPDLRLPVQDLYLQTLRAAHAGQALDLAGCRSALAAALDDGDFRPVREHVLTTHALKTGAPVANFARIGVLLGEGSEQQQEAIARLGEALGIGYQIADDVLDLSGIARHDGSATHAAYLRPAGEDLRQGTVTLPLLRTLERLQPTGARDLWKRIDDAPGEPATLAAYREALTATGALEACLREADDMIDTAWQRLDPLFDDSDVKLMIRAFTHYAVDRARPTPSETL